MIGDRLILEADGKTHDGDSRHTDRVRDAVAMALGFSTLRFDSALILRDRPLVEAAILSALAADLHRSPAGRRWGGESSTPVIPAAHSGRSADLEPGSSGRTPNGSLRG